MATPYALIPDAFPELHTERLLLRGCQPSDAQRWFERARDPRVVLPTSAAFATSLADAETAIRHFRDAFVAKEELRWALVVRPERDACGTCGLFDFDPANRRAEVGYGLDPHLHGMGLATEALRAVLAYGFGALQLHRIQATVLAGNVASQRVLSRCGFQLEGTLRGYKQVRGAAADFTMHAILRPTT